jgi:hypothetical protein
MMFMGGSSIRPYTLSNVSLSNLIKDTMEGSASIDLLVKNPDSKKLSISISGRAV